MEPQVDTGAPSAPETTAIAMTPPAGTPERLSPTAAASVLAKLRHQRLAPGSDRGAKEEQPPADEQRTQDAAPATPAQESADPAGAAPPGSDPGVRGEIEGANPDAPPEPPPIEPPRSWTKEDKELFTSLPRETQERIAERERSRESDFLRRQNDAADKLKGLTAKEQAADQARQHYEAALPLLFQTLQHQQASDFADIKTIADLERLAREDSARYLQWDLAQKRLAHVTQQMVDANTRQLAEREQQFLEFAKRQDELVKEKAPDLADEAKAAQLQKAAVAVLNDLGFAEAELVPLWNGQKELSLRDHRVQLLIRDATLWRDAQAKAKAAAAKPVPPVQRPGVSQPKGTAQEAQVQALTTKLEKTGSLKDAAALLRARRSAAR
jgi:hypothetical protein